MRSIWTFKVNESCSETKSDSKGEPLDRAFKNKKNACSAGYFSLNSDNSPRIYYFKIVCICLSLLYVGTTWVQEIVWQIYNDGAISSEKLLFRFPFLEARACNANEELLIDFKSLPSPRLIKSHLTYSTIPKSADEAARCKYIYVARNPKDVAVSYFHFMEHWKKIGVNDFSGPWEFCCKLFIEGNGKLVKFIRYDKLFYRSQTEPEHFFLYGKEGGVFSGFETLILFRTKQSLSAYPV